MAEGGKVGDIVSPYSDPVFKKISLKNGEINKLSYSELKKLARKLQICVEGSSDILRKRLKSHYRKKYLKDAEMKMPKKPFPYYIIIDFEATCEDKDSTRTDYPHEIIEFPAVVVNSETLAIENVFHEYVRPASGKKLSEYCIALTGISQSQVDASDSFPSVLQRFEEWLQNLDLVGRSAIVTDGPWDMARFLYMQVKASKLPYPKFAKRWVNIKKAFSNFYNQRKPKLDVMLKLLNFEFEGRRHSGIDDSRNIAKVLIQMLKDGAYVQINERIDLSSFQSNSFLPVSEIVKPVKVEDDYTFWKKTMPQHKAISGQVETTEEKEEKEVNEYEVQMSEVLYEEECSSGNEIHILPVEENTKDLSSLHLNCKEDGVIS